MTYDLDCFCLRCGGYIEDETVLFVDGPLQALGIAIGDGGEEGIDGIVFRVSEDGDGAGLVKVGGLSGVAYETGDR